MSGFMELSEKYSFKTSIIIILREAIALNSINFESTKKGQQKNSVSVLRTLNL